MGLNLANSKMAYNELKNHIGHNIVCVGYASKLPEDVGNPVNVAIECEDCGEVLIDFTRTDWEA